MRGRTLDNAFVILDEAQNDTFPNENVPNPYGKSAKFMVTGDPGQVDCLEELFQDLRSFIDFERY
jgi:phosphate starvation-inducible PhoH-like protein